MAIAAELPKAPAVASIPAIVAISLYCWNCPLVGQCTPVPLLTAAADRDLSIIPIQKFPN